MSDALMRLDNVDTAALLPGVVGGDPDVAAILAALDGFWREIAPVLPLLGVLATIDRQSSEVCDRLAWQFHCDFWDASWPVETKRWAIIDSIRLHRIAGTRGAVDDVIATIWGASASVAEWWEYGGEPGTFTVFLESGATEEQMLLFAQSIRKVKRATDHLTMTTVSTVDEPVVRVGVCYQEHSSYRLTVGG